jgi:hypothetical protein
MGSSRRFGFSRSVLIRGSYTENVQPKAFVIEPSLVGANTVYFGVTSNMPNQTLYYTIPGVENTDFVENSVNGSFTTDSNGNATITRTLIPDVNLEDGNKKFNVQIRAYSTSGEVRATSANILINKFAYPTVTGGDIIDFVTPTEKRHVFTGNGTLSINSIGDTTNANLWYVVAGGGGAGGGYLNPIGPASTITAVHAGGGGGGGSVIENNTTIAVSNISVTIGQGGNANIRENGFSSAFGNVTAPGGGAGGAVTLYDQINATPVTNTSTQHNGVTGANGGGGASKARRNTFRNVQDPAYFNEIVNGTGASSNVGGFSGGNSVAYGPTSAQTNLDYVLNYLGISLQFSTYPSATAGGGGGGAGGNGSNGRILQYNANSRVYEFGAGGEGGIGALTLINGINTRLGGGGSGGSGFRMPGTFGTAGPGGEGGGGNGIKWSPNNIDSNLTVATNGTPNTGGGGGGGIVSSGGTTYRPGNGGSGVAIVRYTWDNPRKLALE